MQQEASIGAHRDRLSPRLAELARKLEGTPSKANVDLVRAELERLARG